MTEWTRDFPCRLNRWYYVRCKKPDAPFAAIWPVFVTKDTQEPKDFVAWSVHPCGFDLEAPEFLSELDGRVQEWVSESEAWRRQEKEKALFERLDPEALCRLVHYARIGLDYSRSHPEGKRLCIDVHVSPTGDVKKIRVGSDGSFLETLGLLNFGLSAFVRKVLLAKNPDMTDADMEDQLVFMVRVAARNLLNGFIRNRIDTEI